MSTTDYRAYANYSLGIRNNNPGNIRPGDNWVGMVGTNKNFVVFKDIHHGLRALAVDVSNKINKGYDTINKLISRYAPPIENDTKRYVQVVTAATGIGPDEKLTANFDTLKKLIRSIVMHENGADGNLITDSDIDTGIGMMPQTIISRVKDFFQNNPAITTVTGHVKSNGIAYAAVALIVVICSVLYFKNKK